MGLVMTMYHGATLSPLSSQVGGAGDADEYSWFLSWMPFALGHGLDPLVSTYVNAPGGINLMWNTSVVLPSFLMAPVTVVLGAAFSYNVLVIGGIALTLTASYAAFRRWTGRLPAFFGALVVGFSPYMVSQSAGHLAQVLIMSAPLAIIVLDRLLVVQTANPWVDGLLLGLLGWAQFLTGEEILAIEVVTATVAVAVLAVLSRHELGRHWAHAARGLLVAGGVFCLLSAPFLAVQYFGPFQVQDVHPRNAYVSDLLNFVVPTDITKIAPAAAIHISSHFTGNGSEEGAYIGVPLLVFVLFVAPVLARRRRVVWVAMATAVGAGVFSMGPTVHYHGHVTHVRLPDYYLQKLGPFHNILPDRFASMMTVGVGLLVALGCNELKRLRRPAAVGGWAWVALGLTALLPVTDFPAAASPLYTAFDSGLSCPARAAGATPPVALVLPAIDEMDLRWQAEANFCFVMPSATGTTGTNSGDLKDPPLLLTLGSPYAAVPPKTPAMRAEAAEELQQLHVQEIVVAPEWPSVPVWTPQGQAETVVWVEWLLGQVPVQSHDVYKAYVWQHLPPVSSIAEGKVAQVPGVAAP